MLRTTTVAFLLFGTLAPCQSKVLLTTKQALALTFPGAKIERKSITLSKVQKAIVQRLTGRPFRKSMVFAYVARRKGKVLGTAWFDVHRVRTKKQLLMVAVGPRHKVLRVEVLAFAEPRKYLTPNRWRQRLNGLALGKLKPGRDIPRITGATLTVNATTRCVQRVLALHRAVFGQAAKSRPHSRPASLQERR